MIGKLWSGGSANPLVLDDPGTAWRVEAGHANLFLVDGRGVRQHLFRLESGDAMLGVDPDLQLVAIGSLDSRFRSVNPEAVNTDALAGWVAGLTGALREPIGSWHDRLVEAGPLTAGGGDRVRLSSAGPGWVRIGTDSAWLQGAARLPPEQWIALADHARVEFRAPSTAQFANELPAEVTLASAAVALAQPALGAIRHSLANEAAALQERRSAARRYSEDALAEGLALLSGLQTGVEISGDASSRDVALAILCRALRHAEPTPATTPPGEPEADLAAVLSAAALRSRSVILRPNWWRTDGLPLLARMEDGDWIALLPSRRRWRAVGRSIDATVDAALAERISADAMQLYPALPTRTIGFRDMVPLALQGLLPDLKQLLLAGSAGAIAALGIPLASQTLFDRIVPLGDHGGLAQVLAGLVAIAVASAIFAFVQAVAIVRIEARADANLQAALFDRLLRLPVGFFRRYSAGDLAQRTLGFQTARERLSTASIGAVLSLAFALANIGVMFWIDARLAAMAMPPTLVIAGTTFLLARARLREERLENEAKGSTGGFMLQLLVGIAKLRTSAAEARGLARWARQMAVERGAIARGLKIGAAQQVAMATLPGFATMIVFLAVVHFAKSDVAAAGLASLVEKKSVEPELLTAGGFIAFAAAFSQLTAALSTAATGLTQLLSVAPLLERTRPLLDTAPETAAGGVRVDRLEGAIDLRTVTFRYTPGAPAALDALDLSIAAGEFVAIVGASGSGKSTILRLLLGFERPERGEIFYDGTALERLDVQALRQSIGIVLQHGRVTAGSLFDNIVGTATLGLDDAWAAARLVGLAADIEAMPMGMHTVLTDGGRTLSGGQRQRVLLARALVQRPGLLLLDEATSALDNRTQAIVTETLSTLSVTRIVIAHRLSTIRNVDRILVMEGGRLVESGTYDALMARDGAFAALARRQLL